jgi:hypothetical protein
MRECNKAERIGQALSATGDRVATGWNTSPRSLISRKTSRRALLQAMPVDAPHRRARAAFVQDNAGFPMQ